MVQDLHGVNHGSRRHALQYSRRNTCAVCPVAVIILNSGARFAIQMHGPGVHSTGKGRVSSSNARVHDKKMYATAIQGARVHDKVAHCVQLIDAVQSPVVVNAPPPQ